MENSLENSHHEELSTSICKRGRQAEEKYMASLHWEKMLGNAVTWTSRKEQI